MPREVIPEEVDLSMHFRPHRTDNVIEVISWERTGGGEGERQFKFGAPKLDLHWQEGAFWRPQNSRQIKVSGSGFPGPLPPKGESPEKDTLEVKVPLYIRLTDVLDFGGHSPWL